MDLPHINKDIKPAEAEVGQLTGISYVRHEPRRVHRVFQLVLHKVVLRCDKHVPCS